MPQRHAVRGRILTFVADPADVGPAASHRYWADGVVVLENGLIAGVGDAADLLPEFGGRPGRSLPGPARPAGPDRHPSPLPADPGDRFLRRPAAGMAAEVHLRRGAEVRRSGACRARRRLLPGRAFAQRHHHGRGLLQRAPGIGRGILRREPSPQHADDRGQGDDGPRRARGPPRYGRAWLPREQGAARQLARGRAPALRDQPTICADVDRGAAGSLGCARARASGLLRSDPSRREPRRDRNRAAPLSSGIELHRHLRPLWPARSTLSIRPLRPSRRT